MIVAGPGWRRAGALATHTLQQALRPGGPKHIRKCRPHQLFCDDPGRRSLRKRLCCRQIRRVDHQNAPLQHRKEFVKAKNRHIAGTPLRRGRPAKKAQRTILYQAQPVRIAKSPQTRQFRLNHPEIMRDIDRAGPLGNQRLDPGRISPQILRDRIEPHRHTGMDQRVKLGSAIIGRRQYLVSGLQPQQVTGCADRDTGVEAPERAAAFEKGRKPAIGIAPK